MVLHCGYEEQLLASGSASGQGEDGILHGSRAMALHGHALWPLQSFSDIWAVNGNNFDSPHLHGLCLVYLDDVIIIGRTFQEHLLKLQKVLQRFREASLTLNLKNSKLFRRKSGTSTIVCLLRRK